MTPHPSYDYIVYVNIIKKEGERKGEDTKRDGGQKVALIQSIAVRIYVQARPHTQRKR